MSWTLLKIKWHPVTRQRWARFRGMRRGWWAFWILLGAYALSLGSEWLANDRPLWIRYEGKMYFPVVKFYPEDAFIGNGRMTRPDYKAFAASGAFAGESGNRMVWPLIPYGPLESLKPSDIELPDQMIVTAIPEPRVVSADISAEGRVVRTSSGAEFFGLIKGESIELVWELPEPIQTGLSARFSNRASPAIDAEASRSGGATAWISLSPYTPRSTSPVKLRLTFREALASSAAQRTVVDAKHPIWPKGFPALGTEGWRFSTKKEEVHFPFRPVKGHPLGLDSSGRDVAARMLYAFRTSLSFGIVLVLMTMVVGTMAGAVQGYYGGKVDLLGQRFIEIWQSLPFIYVLILLGSVYGQSFLLLLSVYAVFNWIGLSYYMRAEFLRLRKLPFVEAARVIGLPTRKILFRHMLPNALVPLVTFFPFSLVGAIGVMAALDYLGFGLPPPTPSWGELLSQAQEFPQAWWLVLYPALALFAVMLAGVFVGEGLRAAFDPRTHGQME